MSVPRRDTASTRADAEPSPALREGAFGHARHWPAASAATSRSARSTRVRECFGPIEIGYDFPAVTRASIEAGPMQHLALPAAAPGAAPTSSASPNIEPGFSRLLRPTTSARELRMRNL